jgi:hypothetical protein
MRLSYIKTVIFMAALASAQTVLADDDPVIITEHINKSGIITVDQPEALEKRLAPPVAESQSDEATEKEATNTRPQRKIGGYRVQVFSDNNTRTAKTEARSKAKTIADAFPQYPTYVVYSSPYWRLKVGDFKTKDEADTAAAQIKKAFPAYASEVRVVRDRINVK